MAFVLNMVAAMSMFDDTKFQDMRNFFFFFLLSGFVFYFTMYARYRNSDERHHYEFETKHEMSNLKCEDKFSGKLTGLVNPLIEGENSSELKGDRLDLNKDPGLKKVIDKGLLDEIVKNKKKINDIFD